MFARVFLICSLSILAPTLACAWSEKQEIEVSTPHESELRTALAEVEERRAAGTTEPLTIMLPAGTIRLSEVLQIAPETVGEGLVLAGSAVGKTTISGTRVLPAPRRDAQGNWRWQLPADWNRFGVPRLLLVDGVLRPAARWPNSGYLRIARAFPDRRSGFHVGPGDLPGQLDPSTGTCDLILLHDWSSSRLPVAKYDAEAGTVQTVGPIGCAAPHYAIDHFEKQPRYWLEGHSTFADQPGEWYIDSQTSEIVMMAGKTEAQAPAVELPWLEQLLRITGNDTTPAHNCHCIGLRFTGTRFPMPAGGVAAAQATMHEPRDADGQVIANGRPLLTAAVHVERAEQCVIDQCQFEALGGTALWVGGQTTRCEVARSHFADVGGNAINLGEDNARGVRGRSWYQSAPEQVPTGNHVHHCEITRCGQMLPGSVAIWAALHRQLEIAYNQIHHCPYTGISLGWLWSDTDSPAGDNHLHHNHIQHVMQVLSDGGGIYTLGKQPGSVIEYNQIAHVPLNAGRAESNGMFLDEGTTGFTIQHNTIRQIDRSPLRFHRAGKNLVRENAWELATPDTPPVRFNNTPAENITIQDNQVLEPTE